MEKAKVKEKRKSEVLELSSSVKNNSLKLLAKQLTKLKPQDIR